MIKVLGIAGHSVKSVVALRQDISVFPKTKNKIVCVSGVEEFLYALKSLGSKKTDKCFLVLDLPASFNSLRIPFVGMTSVSHGLYTKTPLTADFQFKPWRFDSKLLSMRLVLKSAKRLVNK